MRNTLSLIFILVVTLFSLAFVWPNNADEHLPNLPGNLSWPNGSGLTIGEFDRSSLRLGLDLQGGTRLLLQAEVPTDFDGDLTEKIDGTISVLRKRVDGAGVAESEITRQGASNISVQLPGISIEQARSLIGRTAQLRFCEPAQSALLTLQPCDSTGLWYEAVGIVNGEVRALTGAYLEPNTFVSFDEIGGAQTSFEFNDEGAELFEQITSRAVDNRGKFSGSDQIAIFLDADLLSAPRVNAVIRSSGVITGMTRENAQELVVQLNAGALPLSLTVLQEQTVDATLGADSISKSLLAGFIGLILVGLFMTLYYRFPGLLAVLALTIYAIVTLALFKLIPVTLTLAAIGGFILSVGMAVDANILIFERMKEELRIGRSAINAVDAGFSRAWSSIRDSNITTLITCFILYLLGGGIQLPLIGTFSAPLVQGFALTLGFGVLVSMFSSIVVTRTLLRTFVKSKHARHWISLGSISASQLDEMAESEGAG